MAHQAGLATETAAHGGLLRVYRAMSHLCLSFPRACRKQRPNIGAEGKRGVHYGALTFPSVARAWRRLGEAQALTPAFTKGLAL